MKEILKDIVKEFQVTGDIKKDVCNLLGEYNRNIIADHSLRVSRKAKVLARQFGGDEEFAEIAGLLHDISGVIPNGQKLEVARKLNIEVLQEEELVPSILHQKISKVIAEEIFDIRDTSILAAISCHTTLRANATKMDMILFIADKLEWDQTGAPPYFLKVEEQLKKSLELGVYTFIKYQLDNRENLMVLHPWLEEAYLDLKAKVICEDADIK